MTEPNVHTAPGGKSKRKGKEVTCPECGHTWRSRGKGKYYRCPRCYERATGKKLGAYFKETKGLTLRENPNDGEGGEEKLRKSS